MEGRRHLASIFFHETETVTRFVPILMQGGIDVSGQSYKANYPVSCMTKLPLATTPKAVECLTGKMDAALRSL